MTYQPLTAEECAAQAKGLFIISGITGLIALGCLADGFTVVSVISGIMSGGFFLLALLLLPMSRRDAT
jgi:hypothetical protein